MEQTQVDQVGKLLERLRNPGHALTATGGLRQRRLLDNLRIVNSEKQEEEFKVPEATWD